MGVTFDKFSFVKRLEDAGAFTRSQAEALSDAIHQAVSESVATKQDVHVARQEVAATRTEVQHDIALLRSELQQTGVLIRVAVRSGLTETRIWTVCVGVSVVAILAAMKYFG